MAHLRINTGSRSHRKAPLLRVKLPACLGGLDFSMSLRRLPEGQQKAFMRLVSAKVDILAIHHKRRGIALRASDDIKRGILADLERFELECIAKGKLFEVFEDIEPDACSVVDGLNQAADTLDDMLSQLGFATDMNDRQEMHLRSCLNRAQAGALQGDWAAFRALRESLAASVQSAPSAAPVEVPSRPVYTVQAAIDGFMAEKEAGSFAAKTMKEYRTFYPALAEALGADTDIAQVSRDALLSWRDAHLAEKAHATVKKRLGMVSTFFKWLEETQRPRLPMEWYNPATRLHPQKGKADRMQLDHEERKRWEDGELLQILEAAKTAPYTTKWMARIGVYTGARLNEIAQLRKDDVRSGADGLLWLHISEDGPTQHLKTKNARRDIPLGFPHAMAQEFIGELAIQPGERVFPELTYRKSEESYGNSAGKHVNDKFLKLINPTKSFHGLRHSFMDRCKQREVNETLVKEFVGHELDDITTGRYGKRFTIEKMRESLSAAGVWDF